MKGIVCGCNALVAVKKLDCQGLAVWQPQRRPFPLAARREQKIVGLLEQGAIAARTVADRGRVSIVEDGRVKFVAERLEELEFVRPRLALRLHVGVGKVGNDPFVGRIHHVLVGPLEIEAEADRLADARIA